MEDLVGTSDTTTYAASLDAASCGLGDGAALLDLQSGTYYSINAVAAHVWETVQTPVPFETIVNSVEQAFEVDAATCERDVEALLADLAGRGLIKVVNG